MLPKILVASARRFNATRSRLHLSLRLARRLQQVSQRHVKRYLMTPNSTRPPPSSSEVNSVHAADYLLLERRTSPSFNVLIAVQRPFSSHANQGPSGQQARSIDTSQSSLPSNVESLEGYPQGVNDSLSTRMDPPPESPSLQKEKFDSCED